MAQGTGHSARGAVRPQPPVYETRREQRKALTGTTGDAIRKMKEKQSIYSPASKLQERRRRSGNYRLNKTSETYQPDVRIPI